MRRVVLFVATNLAILLVLGVVSSLLEGALVRSGVEIPQLQLLVFAAVFGFGGSLISLALSKPMALRATGARLIEQPSNDAEAWLAKTVERLARDAGIGRPQVAVFPSPSPNAFATGARRDSALVAVSDGLLRRMDRGEIEAVLGHEVSHVANGDMVTLTLIQGVLNTFVLLFSRVIGDFVDRNILRNERGPGVGRLVVTILAQVVLGILATIIVLWFSRQREFRADAGGARLAGTDRMIAALERLKEEAEPAPLPREMAAFGIAGGPGIARLFMTHPPLDERIAALRARRAG
jgi:heat shock protein HtpX